MGYCYAHSGFSRSPGQKQPAWAPRTSWTRPPGKLWRWLKVLDQSSLHIYINWKQQKNILDLLFALFKKIFPKCLEDASYEPPKSETAGFANAKNLEAKRPCWNGPRHLKQVQEVLQHSQPNFPVAACGRLVGIGLIPRVSLLCQQEHVISNLLCYIQSQDMLRVLCLLKSGRPWGGDTSTQNATWPFHEFMTPRISDDILLIYDISYHLISYWYCLRSYHLIFKIL